jgi:Tfp pilus assembly protein PilF
MGNRVVAAMAAACALLLASGALAQESGGTAPAKAELVNGQAAAKAKKPDAAVQAFRKAIELDPAFVAAHEEFASATYAASGGYGTDAGLKALDTAYRSWIAAHPTVAGYHWGLGNVFYYKDPALAERECRAAVALDPRFAKAWNTLSLFSEMKGDNAGAEENLKRATEASPGDPSYLFYYARQVLRRDPAEGVRLSLQVVDRFPGTERAAQSLYWLGNDAEDPARKLAYLERLRKEYPPAKFNWSESGMSLLVDAYAAVDSAKAVALAKEMAAALPDDKTWQASLALQAAFARSRALLAEKKGAEALAVLEPLKPPRWGGAMTLLPLLQAEADASANGARKAYDRLAPAVAAAPADALVEALLRYGAAIGRTPAQVDDDLWAIREKQAEPAAPFDLPTYDGRRVSLAGYRGKVFLLNFWYPG